MIFTLNVLVIMPARKRTFTAEQQEQFKKEHEMHFPSTNLDPVGYPDVGEGWYSKKLDYKAWVLFNSAMRS